MKKLQKDKGFLRLIVIIIAVFLLLAYFNISIQSVAESPTNQQNVSYVKGKSATIWHTYLEVPAHYLWNNIFINLLWNSFVENLQRIKDGQPTTLEEHAPTIAP